MREYVVPVVLSALAAAVGYRAGWSRGVAAERLRIQYIFVSAHQIVMGGALWILSERLFGHEKDDSWMHAELRNYIEKKETRKLGERNTQRLSWSLGEAEALVNAEYERYQATLVKDPAAPYDTGAIAEAYGMLEAAVRRYLNEPTKETGS